MSELRIAYWPVDRLVPYAGNPRRNDAAVPRMVEDLRTFGFRAPLLAKSDGELIDGHLRLKAAVAMGMAEVPVILADDFTPEQVRAYRLIVNRSAAWASWDDDLLIQEIMTLVDAKFDIALTGFDQHELDKLLKAAATEQDPDAVPDIPEMPLVREGELWLLGPHRLYCGDALNSVHVGYLLGGREADMIWTDPPYNVGYEGRAGTIRNDRMSAADFYSFLLRAHQRMFAALRPGGPVYVAHAEAGDGMAFRRAFSEAGFRLASCLIWNKGQSTLSRGDYHWQHEPILYGWKPGAAHKWYGDRKARTILETGIGNVKQQEDGSCTLLLDGKLYRLRGELEELSGTVINVRKPNRSELHPTTKPVELVAICVANLSRSGGLVLDSFGGSGTTMIACEQMGRACCGMKIDPRYAQAAIMRWQNFTGKQAVRESDGMLFDELAGL
ncbi:MAG: DNA modification methylase [Desulfobulbus sp.]|nr:DNA modification methylase [Desulfobulbus sp.]